MYSNEKIAIAIFLPRVLMYQKRQISLPVCTKPRGQKQDTGNDCDVISGPQALRKTDFSVIFLLWANQFVKKWYNSALLIRKYRRNLFFAKLGVLKWRNNRSQSAVFGLAVLYPTGSEIWRFWYIKTRGRKIAIKKKLPYLSVQWEI